MKRRALEPAYEGSREDNTAHFISFPRGVFVVECLCKLHSQLRSRADGVGATFEILAT